MAKTMKTVRRKRGGKKVKSIKNKSKKVAIKKRRVVQQPYPGQQPPYPPGQQPPYPPGQQPPYPPNQQQPYPPGQQPGVAANAGHGFVLGLGAGVGAEVANKAFDMFGDGD